MSGQPRRRDLGALDPIDSDPVTRRYAVGNRLPGRPAPLWYREIRPEHELPDGVNPAAVRTALGDSVALRDRCSPHDRAELDARTDWPLALVTEQDRVVGVLSPGLPDDFLLPGSTPAAEGSAGRRPMTLRDLCASDEAAAANGVDRSAVDGDLVRLALAAHLARTIHLLHRNRIAYSDLTLARVAIAGHPPRTVLTGCDPTVPLQAPAPRRAAATRAQTLDPARLALCLIRALAKGPGATQLTDPARVGALLGEPGVGLFSRALAAPPAQRPSAEQMHRYLSVRLVELAREHGLIDRVAPLPRFDIAAQLQGTLPRLAVPALPTVAPSPAPAALPRRPLVSTDEHPPPRIELPALRTDTMANPGAVAAGPAQIGSVVAHAYVDANQQIAATLRDGLRTLRDAIDDRLPVSGRLDTAPVRSGHQHSRGSTV